MQYYYNLKKQYKIWISPNPEQFLSIRNQLRFIHEIHANTGVEMRLVYSSVCLTDDVILKMHKFCTAHNVIPVAFESLIPQLTKPRECQLAAIACEEIEKFRHDEGGNLAAASDCIRLLSVVIETCGVYSDFDVRNTLMRVVSQKISWGVLEGPVLFFGTQMPQPNSNDIVLMCNNDFLAFSLQGPAQSDPNRLSSEALRCLENLQQEILDRYSSRLTLGFFLEQMHAIITQCKRELGTTSPVVQYIASLQQDTSLRTLFALRKHLLHLTTLNTDELIQNFLWECLKKSVTWFSGPDIYQNLFAHLIPGRKIDCIVKKDNIHQAYLEVFLRSSIGYYDLIYDNINSPNETLQVLKAIHAGRKAGGDLSWMPDGSSKMTADDAQLTSSAHFISTFWRKKYFGFGAKDILATPVLVDAINKKHYALTLRKAVVGGKVAIIHCLLVCRTKKIIDFDLNESSSNGNTALDWAILTTTITDEARKNIINMLRAAGAHANNATLDIQVSGFLHKS